MNPDPINAPNATSKTGKVLLVASIFAPSRWNRQWYALQKRFLRQTTEAPYDYRIILNGVGEEGFEREDILHINEKNEGHSHALMQLVDYFRGQPYSDYLILDSDAFPIRQGWHGILTNQMEKFGKTLAAPIRSENLDLFPHPSIFFLHGEAVNSAGIDFHTGAAQKNMLGIEVGDVGAAMQGREDLLPLLRTNRVNLHPVAAAVYHHLFYHHAAGSRGMRFRVSEDYAYHAHWLDNSDRERQAIELFNELVQDPGSFIQRLTDLPQPRRSFVDRLLGWN